MSHYQITPELYLIPLDQKLEGFREFISSWVYIGNHTIFLVDPGPRQSIEALLAELRTLKVDRIDYVLLTHIHVDHAGAAGKLLSVYPMAEAVCHPKGIQHMVAPEQLWKGTLSVLGEIAEAYGEIYAVPEERISFAENLQTKDGEITALKTPGHAAHHLSYMFNGILFAGEVAGLSYSFQDKTYARPATPPRFKLEISLESVQKAIDLNPQSVCLGHYGASNDALAVLNGGRDQLNRWTETVRDFINTNELQFDEPQFDESQFFDAVINQLIITDPLFSNFQFLDDDIKKRENYFVRNSLKGMKEYIESGKGLI